MARTARRKREARDATTFSIARLIELHAERPEGETFYIRDGVFANDEPAESPAGRWVASMHELEVVMRVPDAPSDFDTLHDLTLRPEQQQQAGSGTPHRANFY